MKIDSYLNCGMHDLYRSSIVGMIYIMVLTRSTICPCYCPFVGAGASAQRHDVQDDAGTVWTLMPHRLWCVWELFTVLSPMRLEQAIYTYIYIYR